MVFSSWKLHLKKLNFRIRHFKNLKRKTLLALPSFLLHCILLNGNPKTMEETEQDPNQDGPERKRPRRGKSLEKKALDKTKLYSPVQL
jgi:hypothetical protein